MGLNPYNLCALSTVQCVARPSAWGIVSVQSLYKSLAMYSYGRLTMRRLFHLDLFSRSSSLFCSCWVNCSSDVSVEWSSWLSSSSNVTLCSTSPCTCHFLLTLRLFCVGFGAVWSEQSLVSVVSVIGLLLCRWPHYLWLCSCSPLHTRRVFVSR